MFVRRRVKKEVITINESGTLGMGEVVGGDLDRPQLVRRSVVVSHGLRCPLCSDWRNTCNAAAGTIR